LIHWIDCNGDKVTAQTITDYYDKSYHKTGVGNTVTINSLDVEEALSCLVSFSHLFRNDDGSYSVNPMGANMRTESKAAFLHHPFAGKVPLEV
jgi:hypothetical protein